MLQAAKTTEAPDAGWLTRYYATRAGVSVIWVAAAFALGKTVTPLAAILLVLYPAWDAAANITDASRNGGLRANLTQAFNAIASAIVTIAVGVASAFDAHAVFYIFGGWAFLAGLLQLATAIRRWAGSGAQWPMILSGAQSALAGAFFIKQAADGIVPTPADIAPYAAFGAIYFTISAGMLAFSALRHRRAAAAI